MQQAPEAMTLKVIAHIHTAFPTKFGIPRQSGLVEELRGEIVFTPGIPQPRRPARTGGFQSYLAGVAVFRRGAGKLVSHRAPAAPWRQHPGGRVCHPLPLPTEPSGAFQRKAGGH